MLGEQCDARHAERERSLEARERAARVYIRCIIYIYIYKDPRSLEARERAVRVQLAQRASGRDKTRMPSGPIRLSLKSSVWSTYTTYNIYIFILCKVCVIKYQHNI